MDPLMIAALALAALCSLASRALMKRVVAKRLGEGHSFLLEADFLRATKGDPLRRGLLAVELASWAGTAALVAALAERVLTGR